MSGGMVQALQLIAALSILILLHEFGHFFFARLFKTRVEKFYLFFDFLFPFPGLLNFSLFKKKKGDTEYGLGWFPLGGYVKIAGMVDESMDKEAMKLPPQPWEYRSKKAWQRLFIMLGGIIMNVIVAIAIYAFIFGVWGEKYLPVKNVVHGIAVDSVGESMGLQCGDMIVGADGKEIERFNMITYGIVFDGVKTLQVIRNGEKKDIDIPKGTIGKILKKKGIIAPRMPFVIGEVEKKSAADKMGIMPGDSVIAVNNQPIQFFDEYEHIKRNLGAQPITLTVVRKGKPVTFTGSLPADKRLGVGVDGDMSKYYKYRYIPYSGFSAIGRGFTYTAEQVRYYWQQLKLIFTSPEVKAHESVGGIASFAKGFSPVFDWQDFLMFTAFVSIILAVMNLLPVPGLDGGYVFFLLYELITRRKVSDKVMERATTVGLVLLLGLMLYANGLDVLRAFKK
ncbi:MAG: RIP metalloprotease RseP [Bacteroidetes bacterium]|nr:RIP metalloprotease RseP [Bacteroidota bacterium]